MQLFMAIEKMTFVESLGLSLLGILVVFVGLIALSMVIVLISYFSRKVDKKAAQEQTSAPAASVQTSAAPAGAQLVPARGSVGEIKLGKVDDRTAALVMAIAADEIGAPLNELKFLSIREVVK